MEQRFPAVYRQGESHLTLKEDARAPKESEKTGCHSASKHRARSPNESSLSANIEIRVATFLMDENFK